MRLMIFLFGLDTPITCQIMSLVSQVRVEKFKIKIVEPFGFFNFFLEGKKEGEGNRGAGVLFLNSSFVLLGDGC